jgi:hypothetical protein
MRWTSTLAIAGILIKPRMEHVEYQQAWIDAGCHILKHEANAATRTQMESLQPKRVSESVHSGLQEAITYFRNHHHQRHYAEGCCPSFTHRVRGDRSSL